MSEDPQLIAVRLLQAELLRHDVRGAPWKGRDGDARVVLPGRG
jgi:hypothetical protein